MEIFFPQGTPVGRLYSFKQGNRWHPILINMVPSDSFGKAVVLSSLTFQGKSLLDAEKSAR